MLELYTNLQNLAAEFKNRFLNEERGQTMAEYAVVLAVIAVIIVGALTGLSGAISGAIGKVTGVVGGGS